MLNGPSPIRQLVSEIFLNILMLTQQGIGTRLL